MQQRDEPKGTEIHRDACMRSVPFADAVTSCHLDRKNTRRDSVDQAKFDTTHRHRCQALRSVAIQV